MQSPDSLTPLYITPGVGSQIRTFGNARGDNPSNGRDALRQDREERFSVENLEAGCIILARHAAP